jgi:transcriptional regulator with XRE-family HTH domain
VDKNKLLYFIKDRGYKVEEFCEKVGLNTSKFYRRINNESFLISEIWKIAEFLNLTLDDINSIFFVNYVSEKKQNEY